MIGIKTSLKRKKHQRSINKIIRAMNKSICDDPIWLGRFEMRQIHSDFYVYGDKSGAEMIVYVELIDKKTHEAKMVRLEESQFFDYDVWRAMNDFICNDLQISISHEPIEDFRKIKISSRSYSWWKDYWHRIVVI